jgi:hypothetical protein
VDKLFGVSLQLADGFGRLGLVFEKLVLALDHLPTAFASFFVLFVDFALTLGEVLLNFGII